ncbi:hypothetical protein SDC9_169531 [bioreactor metagenome]|uniref:Uncharacterized protein n=1 Tax=bioreactor metagenome TaxID=1076179 RepID=A0A645G5K7_9ZZZZ
MEQQGTAGLAERQVAQFIEDHEVQPQQAGREAPGLALGLLPLQRVDQVHRAVEPYSLGHRADARHADGRGQVGLARAGATYQHHVVRRGRELASGQLRDEFAVYRRHFEVEAGQVAVYRELGTAHLVLHRPCGAVAGLGLQHMLQQPARALDFGAALLTELGPGGGHAVQAQRL